MHTGTNRPARRARLLLLLALGAFAALVGGLLARRSLASPGVAEACRFCPAAARVPSMPRIEGASPAQRALLLRELVTQLAPSGLTLLRLGLI